jgi:peptide/nickel transport system substrate-binding protein
LKQANELLRKAGFVEKADKHGQNVLHDSSGRTVRFRLHTNAGNSLREAQCHFIAADLAKLGIRVDYTPLDFNTLMSKLTSSYDYDALLLGFSHDDPDPTSALNIWLSSGTLHFWWPSQEKPQTSWEERLDHLMRIQATTFDFSQRKKYYDEVQAILADQQPLIFTATPYVFVCAKEGLGNFNPSLSRDRTLWNAEELFWKNP